MYCLVKYEYLNFQHKIYAHILQISTYVLYWNIRYSCLKTKAIRIFSIRYVSPLIDTFYLDAHVYKWILRHRTIECKLKTCSCPFFLFFLIKIFSISNISISISTTRDEYAYPNWIPYYWTLWFSGTTDWSRTQLGWGQFNHFQNGDYGSSHAAHQHSSHASQTTPSSSTSNTAATADWYDQGYDYTSHAQLNYHRTMGGIF